MPRRESLLRAPVPRATHIFIGSAASMAAWMNQNPPPDGQPRHMLRINSILALNELTQDDVTANTVVVSVIDPESSVRQREWLAEAQRRLREWFPEEIVEEHPVRQYAITDVVIGRYRDVMNYCTDPRSSVRNVPSGQILRVLENSTIRGYRFAEHVRIHLASREPSNRLLAVSDQLQDRITGTGSHYSIVNIDSEPPHAVARSSGGGNALARIAELEQQLAVARTALNRIQRTGDHDSAARTVAAHASAVLEGYTVMWYVTPVPAQFRLVQLDDDLPVQVWRWDTDRGGWTNVPLSDEQWISPW